MKIKREKFIDAYTLWMQGYLKGILPVEATEFRMLEITRRQHHQDISHLLKAMKEAGGNESSKI